MAITPYHKSVSILLNLQNRAINGDTAAIKTLTPNEAQRAVDEEQELLKHWEEEAEEAQI